MREFIECFGEYLTSIIDEGDIRYEWIPPSRYMFVTSRVGVHLMSSITYAILQYAYRSYPFKDILCSVSHEYLDTPSRLVWTVELRHESTLQY